MNRKFVLYAVLFATIFGSIFLFATRTPQKGNESGKIKVVTSFYPLEYIATAVGGDLVLVNDLVPAGIEPHEFEPSSRQLVNIEHATLFIYNGAGFEPWVNKWEKSAPAYPSFVVDVAKVLKGQGILIEKDGVINPHFWLDPLIFEKEVEIIRNILIAIDPKHEAVFRENADRLIETLKELDWHFREGLSSCASHDVIVLHDAFAYVARQYGFSATSIAGISPEEEPSPKDLARIITLARRKGIKYIFSETVASPKFSEAIAREIGGTTLVLNPIESMTPGEVQSGQDYISAMGMNLNNLRSAMVCN